MLLLFTTNGCSDPAEANSEGGKSSSTAASEQTEVKKDTEPTLVEVVSLKPELVRDRLPATSHIEVFHNVEVLCQVRAQVKRVLVEQGQEVEKGELLVEMDDREFALEVDNAKVREDEAKNGKESSDLEYEEAVNRHKQAKLDLAKAERDYDRDKRGVEQGVTSPEALDESTAARDRAKNELELARVAESKAKIGQSRAQTMWDSAKITRQLAERTLRDCTIKSPITGVVARLDVRGGEWISLQVPLCQIVSDKNLIVELKRPQSELAILKPGQAVEIKVDAWSDEKFAAKIDLISPTVDRTNGTFTVRARLNDPSRRLKPGMFCRAEVITRISERALMIPKVAVLYDRDQPFAFVARDNRAVRIDITAGIETKDRLEATNKADTGGKGVFGFDDQLIIVDPTKLDDGQPIRFQPKISGGTSDPTAAGTGKEEEHSDKDSDDKVKSGSDKQGNDDER